MAIFGSLNALRKNGGLSDKLAQIAMQAAVPEPRAPVAAYPSGAGMNTPNPDDGIYVNGERANPDRLMKMARPVPPQDKRRGGIGGFLSRFNDQVLPRLVMAGAIAHGDYETAGQVQAAYMRQAAARQQSQTQADQFDQLAQHVAALPGMDARQFLTFLGNPEQWAANMSDALSTHYAAANVGQTETRVFGNPNDGGSVYQPPRLIENGVDMIRHDPMTGDNDIAFRGMTPGQQYARSLGYQPGSAQWNQAVQDAELGANGPTAYGYDTQLEQVRQGNRMQLRGSPTYAQSNPRPRASGGGSGRGGGASRSSGRPTATNSAGQKIEWNGRAWVPVQ